MARFATGARRVRKNGKPREFGRWVDSMSYYRSIVPTIGESSRPTTVEAFGTDSKQEDAAEGGRGG